MTQTKYGAESTSLTLEIILDFLPNLRRTEGWTHEETHGCAFERCLVEAAMASTAADHSKQLQMELGEEEEPVEDWYYEEGGEEEEPVEIAWGVYTTGDGISERSVGDRSSDRASDRTIERSSDRPSDRAIVRSSDRWSDRAIEGAIERAIERSIERSSERSSDRASDRATERPSDR